MDLRKLEDGRFVMEETGHPMPRKLRMMERGFAYMEATGMHHQDELSTVQRAAERVREPVYVEVTKIVVVEKIVDAYLPQSPAMQSRNKSSDHSPGEGINFLQPSDMEKADKSSDQSPSNAKVAENTDGKPLVRERSEDGLRLTLVVLQSISFVLTSPTIRKLVCAEIEHWF